MGKVRVAHNAGKPMYDGVLLDHAGKSTTDPSVMYTEQRGVVLPFGEHKGSGLALVCELLAGAIVGSATVHPRSAAAAASRASHRAPSRASRAAASAARWCARSAVTSGLAR